MGIDMDYEVYKYLNKQVEEYKSLQEILDKNGVTFDEAKTEISNFQKKFKKLCSENLINTENFVQTCFDLMEQIESNPENSDLQYIYLCIITDLGLLNEINSYDRTDEQSVLNYFRQQEKINELTAFLKSNIENANKLNQIRDYLKKSIYMENIDCSEELDLLFKLFEQHDFDVKNAIFRDNLNALITYLNSDKEMKSAKPYIIYAVLSRKHGMMQNRENFLPNIKAVFQYQKYNILHDNGKNFNTYQSAVELYEHLHRAYSDEPEIDIEFCDFCFANLSPLSEWYYTQCQVEYEIPMVLSRKIYRLEPASFPMLFCYDDYTEYDLYEFENQNSRLYRKWRKTVSDDLIIEFLTALCYGYDIKECAEKLPYYVDFSEYAELFLYEESEIYLGHLMLDCSVNFIKI
ncbi:MAG: hypothetical protein MRZ46_07620 [Oscillospiraceae bacterium]|nr:hypothetical protein [Oscillospiraceae bacterium]